MPKESKTAIKKRVAESVDFATKLLKQKAVDAEGVLVTMHVVKDGRIFHNYCYQDFPTGDWGACMVAIGVEARNATLSAQTGAAKK